MRHSTVHNDPALNITHDLQLHVILTNNGKECAVCSSRGLCGEEDCVTSSKSKYCMSLHPPTCCKLEQVLHLTDCVLT